MRLCNHCLFEEHCINKDTMDSCEVFVVYDKDNARAILRESVAKLKREYHLTRYDGVNHNGESIKMYNAMGAHLILTIKTDSVWLQISHNHNLADIDLSFNNIHLLYTWASSTLNNFLGIGG